ncbi:spore germination protein [Clostridium sp. DJ247]|uniref:spore germination protein n=1 Tax=Clostridium sp. DJ247 TaxID=2726188 RepID=UPI001626FBE5|nr:spore germination protein [Clostridium sp. DJ247]MBC2580194.1 spore germination protein [Clostridium sp. DJ247]
MFKNIFSLSDENSKNKNIQENIKTPEYENIKVSPVLEDNKQNIEKIFVNCSDFIIREVKITNNPQYTAMVAYINNMCETATIEEAVIKKLTSKSEYPSYSPGSKEYCKYLLGIRDADIYMDIIKVVDSILSGKLILFIDGINEAMVINITNPPGRSVEEPVVESVVRGPREGFTESISTNRVLIRKIIKSPNLKFELFIMGRETKTDVNIAYLSNIANEKIINKLKERLNKIDIDGVLEANYIKEYIEDEPISNFPTIYSTERPDVVATKLLEGRIAIITNGTPVVITVPAIFAEFMETTEDSYLKFIAGSINRIIRYLSFVLSLTLPGFFLAITTFHQEVIPTPLLVSFMKARADVPYPAFVECFLMLTVYEILREAGVRMPRAVGQAISVVGALVLGESAVQAGLVSTPMVIVVATTGISSFAVPSTDMSTAIIFPRFIFLFLGGFTGLLGLLCGIVILCMKLISIRSFGIPYMEPLAPIVPNELPNIVIRRPLWTKLRRSWFITGKESIRRKESSHIKSIKEGDKKAIGQKKNKE